MSAFIVDDKVYLRILATIKAAKLWEYQHTDLSAEEFVQGLRKRNFDSVNHRYKHHGQPEICEPLGLSIDGLKPYSQIELYKNLACIDYQSCELSEWYGCPEEILLVRLQNEVCSMSIRKAPGWEQAGWGE